MGHPQRVSPERMVANPPESPAHPSFVVRSRSGWHSLPGLRDAWTSRELLYFLTLRDLKLRYKQTALGVAWTFLQPLITAGIFSLVFGKFVGLGERGIPYPLFCLAALLPWNYFSTSLSRCTTSLLASSFLLNKIYVPRVLIPISGLLPGLIDFGVGLVAWFAIAAYYHFVPSAALIWKLPLAMLINLTFVLGLGLCLGALNVRFRDVSNLLPFSLQAWMFLTPVIYPATLVTEKYRWLYLMNPMVPIVDGIRSALLGTPFDTVSLARAGIVSLGTLVLGLWVFSRMERQFADLI